MARAWHRLAAATLLVLSQCKAPKPTPGAPCTIGNNRFLCSDPSTAMLCRNGTWVDVPCRGPQGCSGMDTSPSCDDDLARAGEACLMPPSGDNLACSTDKLDELTCVAGHWGLTRTCKGPKKCAITGNVISCDDSLGDVGDPCVVESVADNYGCSTDKKIEVVCDTATNKFQPSNTCRGAKGCWIEDSKVYCDTAVARVGERCRPLDNLSCSEDSTRELRCSPQLTWAEQRDCKRSGCKIRGSEVSCE